MQNRVLLSADIAFRKSLYAFGVVSLIMTLSPWFLGHKGTVAGLSISIRSLGNILSGILGVVGLGLLFQSRFQQVAQTWAAETNALPKNKKIILIITSAFLYSLPVISHKLRAHACLDTHALDLGFFSNICWNTAFSKRGGEWFYCSLLERNFMAVHVNWILWPLSFFYRWGGDARVLLAAQAVLIAAALPFLWAFTEKATGSFAAGFVICVMFVCSQHVGKPLSNDFHPDVWQIPCLMAALWCWQNESKWGVLLSSILALLAKEDVSFVLMGFSLFLIIIWSGWRKTGVGLLALAIGAFLFHTLYFIPQFLTGDVKSILFERYKFLGNSYADMAMNLFRNPGVYWKALIYDPMKYWRLVSMLFPAGGLTLLSPLFLLPPLISTLPHLLSQTSTQLQLADIYAMPLQPFIFAGAAMGMARLLKKTWVAHRTLTASGACFLIAAAGAATSPHYYKTATVERRAAFFELQQLIPSAASVAAQQNLYSHFDTRRFAQLFPMGINMGSLQTKYFTNPDYVIGDRIGNSIPFSRGETDQRIAELERDPRYIKIFDKENFVAFKRQTNEALDWKTAP